MFELPDGRPVVVFDGVCNLCNRAVDFIVRRDRDAVFALTPNQGETAVALLGSDADDLDTIVLVDSEGEHRESDAVVRIARRLPWPWRAASIFRLVPRPARDFAYRFVARRRYSWFGHKDSCRLPTPEEAARFLP